ncbi:MAG TPA: hypothetical protein VFW85_02295 [Gaiellaceae bacterium]|nr:hypothetical protein [Gaiellaceae bacterium]
MLATLTLKFAALSITALIAFATLSLHALNLGNPGSSHANAGSFGGNQHYAVHQIETIWAPQIGTGVNKVTCAPGAGRGTTCYLGTAR